MTLEIFKMQQTYRPLISEVLKKVNNAKTKNEKIKVLKEHDSQGLRMVIKSSFDPKIKWVFPEGPVPYRENEAPEGTEHNRLELESRKLFRFIQGGDNKTPQFKKENLFLQMLEGLHKSEAEVVVWAKDKELHKHFKGLSAVVVRDAFGWNENFMRSE